MSQKHHADLGSAQAMLHAQLDAFLLKPEPRVVAEIAALMETLAGGDHGYLPRQLFESAVAQSPLAISITDLKANILYCNESFSAVTGYACDEVIGKNESILSYRSTPKRVYEEMWHSLSQRESWKGTLVNRRKNGERYIAEVLISPVLDSDGEPTHYLGIHRDNTELYSLERRVKNQKTLIESVVDAAPSAIAVLDHNRRVILDNHAYKKLVGDMQSEEPASSFLHALHEADPHFHTLMEQRQGFSDRVVECRLGRMGTRRWFNCSGVWFEENSCKADDFFSNETVSYLMLTVHEITTLKRQQEEIKHNAMRALMAEEALSASVRETLAAAAFKLQEPLNLLNAVRAMVERRTCNGDAEPMLEMLAQISEKGAESLGLLQQIMPVAQPEESEPLNINQVIHQVLQVATPRLLTEGIVLEWHPDAGLPPLIGNARELRVMFRHLIDNAIEAIAEAGSAQREIAISTYHYDGWMEVVVADTGCGIDTNLHYKVFEPFYTSKHRQRHHTGMGLTLAQEVVNAHAGTIELESPPEGGCWVKVRLPMARNRE